MSYERQSPDYTRLVAEIAAKYPKEWDLANKEKHGDRTDDFIKIFAYEANKVDFRIGLNGKRGNPNDLSRDAVAYKNDTVPAEFGGCEVIDIIIGKPHGPTWQDVTKDGVAGAWVQPTNPGEGNNPNPVDDAPHYTLETMQTEIDELKSMIEKMIKVGDVISLKSQEWDGQPGKFVCAERNQGGRLIANRDGVGTWEKFTVGKE